ncbi:hypothetical protein M0R45_030099 [Rubus argutus]|uniref:Uncharacterized protein n=1 Tax=Rubus argutus TaxID=59490 RepID=A0AAW1WC51_RUBAR
MVDPCLDFRTGQWKDGLWVVFSQVFLVQQIPTIRVWVTSLVHGNDSDRRPAALGGISSDAMVLRQVVGVFNGLFVDYGGGLDVAGDRSCVATLVVDGDSKACTCWCYGFLGIKVGACMSLHVGPVTF